MKDTAGNVSDPAQISVTVDTAAPSAPSIDLVNDTLGDTDQGDTATDDITKDNVLTLTVTGEAGGLLILEDNGTELVPDGVQTTVTAPIRSSPASSVTAPTR